MRLIITLLFFGALLPKLHSQITLNKGHDIDTLSIWMDFAPDIPTELQQKLRQSVVAGVNAYNAKYQDFYALADSNRNDFSIRIYLDTIKYVEGKDNLLWSAVGVATLGLHAWAITTLGGTLPILLLPAVQGISHVSVSEEFNTKALNKDRLWINPSGYLRSMEKQKERLVFRTQKTTFRILKRLAKQDRKNNR